MTEAEWLASEDPQTMLESLRGTASERKLRLFAVGCCRQPAVHRLLQDDRSRIESARAMSSRCRHTIEAGEQLADEEKSRSELEAAAPLMPIGRIRGAHWNKVRLAPIDQA